MRKLFVIIAALAACATPPKGNVDERDSTCVERIMLSVDSEFSRSRQDMIVISAMEWWQASGGRICFSVQPMDFTKEPDRTKPRTTVNIYSSQFAWQRRRAHSNSKVCPKPSNCYAMTRWDFTGQPGEIYFVFDGNNIDRFRAVMTHELGHILMGHGHSVRETSIMLPSVVPTSRIDNRDREILRCHLERKHIGWYDSDCGPK